jgi:nitrilase
MSARKVFRVAAVQATPAYLNREATLDIVADHVARAGADGVDLVVFPESFVPGYPDWLWRRPPFSDSEWYARFQEQAVEVPGPALDKARAAAEAAGIWVALGITERSSSGSLYNAVVYIDSTGEIAGLHRKLVPTGAERLVWANGQGPMLTVVDIGGVRVASLICWEMYMPLARAALYQQGIDVLLAPTWDNSDEWVPTLRHTAKEGQVFVVGVTAHLRGCDVPRDLPGADDIYGGAEDDMSRGNTTIVAPGGEVLEGPLVGSAGTVTASLDLDRIAAGRRAFDPVGHYARPDILSLIVKVNEANND